MKKKRISKVEDAQPFIYMIQRSFPFYNFENFYIDVYKSDEKYSRPEWYKLVAQCKEGNIDYIIVPSMETLSVSITEVVEQARRLKALPKPVYIYFMEERLNSDDTAFELHCSLLGTLYRELDEVKKKKSIMSKFVKEGANIVAQNRPVVEGEPV